MTTAGSGTDRSFFRGLAGCLAAFAFSSAPLGSATSAQPEGRALTIAVVGSLTGFGAAAGGPALEGARLAVDEANALAEGERIAIASYDDRSSPDGAREVARQAVASDALVVVGPDVSVLCLAAGPIFAEAGAPAVSPSCHGDRITDNATTFRAIFSTSEMGAAIANYLRYALGETHVEVISKDNGYGRPFTMGFKAAADRLGLAASYRSFANDQGAQEAVAAAAADPDKPAIVLGVTDEDARPALIAMKRLGVRSPVFGTTAIANDDFVAKFANQPEYSSNSGFFTDNVYAISPSIADSANAETIAFANRYHARYGREPQWEAIQGYDSMRLAIGAARAAADADATTRGRRQAARDWLAGKNSPEHAVASLTGPLWFSQDRGRIQGARIGRFHGSLFESAPVQLVPVSTPSNVEIANGALVDIGAGRFARRQQVVYTGIFLNELPRLDLAQSTFTADFYLWVRYAKNGGAGGADPTEIDFPDLVRGNFDAKRPATERDLDDGTTYRLWRMRGDFKNDFDLHHYPLDRQFLSLRFFNARAASDRLVYVQDRRAERIAAPDSPALKLGSYVAPTAFRNLTQWDALQSLERRDILVTDSALGDPSLVGVERTRELSGFALTIDLRRRVIATLAKTLLPLGLMALIMYASLHFPVGLVKEKVTVAITAALSGAVLLSSINAQLGGVGYVMAVEYIFYLFFTLCLLCIVSVLAAEQFRVAGRKSLAAGAERATRIVYLVAMVGTIGSAWVASLRW